MKRASVFRIVGAFVAGLVLALASAVVYLRIHDRANGQTAVTQTITVPESTPATPEPSTPPIPEQQPEQKTTAPPEPASAEKEPVKKSHASSAAAAGRSMIKRAAPRSDGPVQVVQNTNPAPALAEGSSAPEQLGAPNSTPAASSPVSAPVEPHVVELAAGTNLVIRVGETISTDHNYADDTFRGTLDEPVIREGFIIADKGSKVLGHVVEADKAGRVRGLANLQVALTEINTTDGQRIAVSTNTVEKEGAKSTGRDTAKIAGGAALGALIGALGGGGKGAAIGAGAGGAAGTGVVLATRGKAAVIPSESRLTFQLAAPVTITEKLNH